MVKLVKIFFSGLCGSQLSEIEGHRGKDKNIPHLLGHEGSGEVIKIGAGVKNFKKGDLVVLHYMKNKNDYEIHLIFEKNAHITLNTETIEVRLEDQNEIMDNENIK